VTFAPHEQNPALKFPEVVVRAIELMLVRMGYFGVVARLSIHHGFFERESFPELGRAPSVVT
jgi:hypothetical protein